MLAINTSGDSWTAARRRAVLLHCLGTEGQRIFYTLPNTGTTYDDAMSALESHFIPKVNVVVARHQFRQRAQRTDETIAQYTSALRELAVDCAYGTVEDEMIRDRLIEKAYTTTVRKKLLLDQPASLEAAVTVACQIEHVLHNVNLLRDTAPVQAVSSKTSHYQSTTQDRPKTKPSKNTASQRACYRCGSNKHLASASDCPASKAKCNSCGKTGHFAKVCRSTTSVRAVLPEVQICNMNCENLDDRIKCCVQISTDTGQSMETEFVVDTDFARDFVQALFQYISTVCAECPSVHERTHSSFRMSYS